MNPIPDTLLLTTAQIAATLIGLLLAGVFFYLETGFRRLKAGGPEAQFLKAAAKLIVLLYSVVLGLSLGLIVLRPLWVTVLLAVLGLAVVAGLVEWTLRSRSLSREVRKAARIQPWLAWPVVVIPLALPWLIGGWGPSREAFTWTILLTGAVAFMNTASLVLLAFDLTAIERAAHADG